MTSDPGLAVDAQDTDVRSATPLPALGSVLAVGWLIAISAWTFIPARGTDFADREALWIPATLAGSLLAVVPPLLVRQTPALLRRQALPFLVLAGVLATGPLLTGGSSFYPLLTLITLVLYVIGWMRLRGRSPLVLLASLATALLWLVGQQVSRMFVIQLDSPIPGQAGLGPEAVSRAVQSLLMVVLPVCIPVLVTGFARFRGSSVQTIRPDAKHRPVDGSADWDALAVASLVLGLVGGGLIAVVLGHIARSQTRRTGEKGSGLAATGLVLGYVGTAAVVALWWLAQLLLSSHIGE